jgi:uncharacterized protein HemY
VSVVLARAFVLVVAVIACAFFVLGIRQAHDTAAATSIITHRGALDAEQVAHARSLLGAAGTLNPDTQVELLRGRLAFVAGDRPGAVASFEKVVGSEPTNVQAWLLLAEAASNDKRLVDQAFLHVTRLDPRG